MDIVIIIITPVSDTNDVYCISVQTRLKLSRSYKVHDIDVTITVVLIHSDYVT